MHHITVPLDGSAFAESALPYVITLAQGPGPCAIDIVGVHVPALPVPRALMSGALEESKDHQARESLRVRELEQYLDETARRLGDALPDRPITCTVRHGPAADELSAHVVNVGTSVTVLTTHGRGGWDRLWFGSVTLDLIRRTGCPVLAVRPAPVPRDYSTLIAAPLNTAVIAIDDTAAAATGLRAVTSLLDHTLDVVRLLHVSPAPTRTLGRVLENDIPEAIAQRAAREAAHLLSMTMASWGDRGYRLASIVREGADAADATVSYLESEGAHLLTLITADPSGLKRLLFGSVTEQLLQRAPVPLLLVPRNTP